MMEFGNVYEVFHIGDIVKVKDIASIYCGEIGVIVGIKETGYYTEPIYIIRMDEPSLYACDSYGGPTEIQVIAKHLAKAGHIDNQKEITMGVRSCKTAYSAIEKIQDEWADSQIEDLKEMLNKLFGGNDSMKNVDVNKIIFSGLKTIVLWTDGTKTIVSMSKDEAKFDPEAAFCAAYTKKMFGTSSKIKRIIKEKSNYDEWKDKDEPDDQLYRLGLKAIAKYEDIDLESIKRVTKEAEKLQDALVQAMYDVLTGNSYEREKGNDEN